MLLLPACIDDYVAEDRPVRILDAAARVSRDHMNPLLAEVGLQVGGFDVLTPLK